MRRTALRQLVILRDTRETWKLTPTHPDYEISSLGRLRRITDGIAHIRAGRILKPWKVKGGYLQVRLDKRRGRKIHHLVLEAFVGPRPQGNTCNHKDGDTSNNVLSNLEWIPHSENILHSFRVLGRKPGGARLTKKDVRMIRKWGAIGVPPKILAKAWGTSQQNMSHILLRDTWKDVR